MATVVFRQVYNSHFPGLEPNVSARARENLLVFAPFIVWEMTVWPAQARLKRTSFIGYFKQDLQMYCTATCTIHCVQLESENHSCHRNSKLELKVF